MSTIYFPISAGFVLVAIILASTHALLPDQQTNPQSAQQPASQPYGGPQLGPETAQWIRRNTDINAVFAIPPSLSGFQIQAQRAQYVNFKAFPFSKTEVREWIRRLQVVAPVESFTPGGALLLARLDSSYLSQTPDEWNYAQVQANIDYLVRPATNDEDWPTENADWCTFKWCVYALPIPFDTSN